MSQNIQVAYSLFGGSVVSLNAQFGINSTPSTVVVDIVSDVGILNIQTRGFVEFAIGSFDFKGIVQSWDRAEIDLAGTGVYQIKLTDTKPVLEAAQVVVGSAFIDYGRNIISVRPTTSKQIIEGIPFSLIKQKIELSTLKYGKTDYKVLFDFTLTSRGPTLEYTVENSVSSLSDLITRIADDHGLDWYVQTTSLDNLIKRISIKFLNRRQPSTATFDTLKKLHEGEIIRYHAGRENRDTIIKTVLVGGLRNYLHETEGVLWKQFWGFKPTPSAPIVDKCALIFASDSYTTPVLQPEFTIALMEKIINKEYQDKEFTEEQIQRVMSYANEFWGRRFYAKITPASALDSNGLPWIIPASAGWWEGDSPPVCFDHNGQLKFETDDGRWVTFVQLPLPGVRESSIVSFQWDDTLYSNPNTHIGPEPSTNFLHGRTVWVKATMEVFGSYFVITLAAPLRIKRITQNAIGASIAIAEIIARTKVIESFDRRVNGIKASINQSGNQTPIDLKADINTVIDGPGTTEQDYVQKNADIRALCEKYVVQETVIQETRMQSVEKVWLALLDQTKTYGPWSNPNLSIGKTELIIDQTLVPWSFGYHGITNALGIADMNKAAAERIRSITDTTTEADTMELQVAGVPKINIGTQLNTTGTLTNITITISPNGITTTYKSNQYSKNQNVQKRKPPGKQRLFKEFELLPKAFPETVADSPKESRDVKPPSQSYSGRITKGYRTNGRATYDLEGIKKIAKEPSINFNRDEFDILFNPADYFETVITGDEYTGIINVGAGPVAYPRLPIGTEVDLRILGEANPIVGGGITTATQESFIVYGQPTLYMDTPETQPSSFSVRITTRSSSGGPIYTCILTPKVFEPSDSPPVGSTTIEDVLVPLTEDEKNNFANHLKNRKEPWGHGGRLKIGSDHNIQWAKEGGEELGHEDEWTGLWIPYLSVETKPNGFQGLIIKAYSNDDKPPSPFDQREGPWYKIEISRQILSDYDVQVLRASRIPSDIEKASLITYVNGVATIPGEATWDLTDHEKSLLVSVKNIGEPQKFWGNISIGTTVGVKWDQLPNGFFNPSFEQQLNLFKPIE